MQFLKTLLWVVIAVFLAVLATRNWHDVTLNLWGDIQADIKLPVLLTILFLVGFLPPFLILRARLWALRRRLGVHERERAATVAPPEAAAAGEETPVI
jgi:lipopolysaccharide assembly protein A